MAAQELNVSFNPEPGVNLVASVTVIDPTTKQYLEGIRDEVETDRTEVANNLATTTQLRDQAAASQSDSLVSEQNAKASETASKTSELNAKASELAADVSEANALASEQASAASEANALASEQAAKLSETNAANSEDAALASEINASNSESAAAGSATAAFQSETNAVLSASEAAASAATAGTSADAAMASETAAKASEDAAAASETSALQSKNLASQYASAASTSEVNAKASETAAADSASAAAASEVNAATSATEAGNQASAAQIARQGAEAAEASTAQLLDQFGDMYLGPKASDPAVDNDGNALQVGASYLNTTENELRYYSGSVWLVPEDVATTAAANAEASAQAAATSEANASNSETTASAAATTAVSAKTAAQASASAAATSESNASDSEVNAASSASTAQTAADTATVKASEASTSASNASTSEANAANSAAAAAEDAAYVQSSIDAALQPHLDAADPHPQYPLETEVNTALAGKVGTGDSRLTNAREWTASTVDQIEAEAGTSTTRRAWTAQRVKQAIMKVVNALTKADVGLGNVRNVASYSQTESDANYLGKTAKAADSDKLDGLHAYSFMRTDASDVVAGNHEFYSTDTSNSYNNAAIELREVNRVTNSQSSDNYAPMISWHWSGRVQTRVLLSSDGDLKLAKGGASPEVLWHAGNFNPSSKLDTGAKAADSDKLDGLSSGSFLRADATDYLTGVMYVRADIRNEDAYRDHGVYGHYDSTKINHIWSMGSSYRVASNGADFGNLYGLAYKHTNNTTGGTLAGGHQMVWCQNGTPKAAMGNDIWTAGKFIGNGSGLTGVQASNGMPSGGIIMWSGSSSSIPSGWALCDGNNGTPDLRGRFIVGAGGSYAEGTTGGSADAVVVAHSHSGSTNSTGSHRHSITTTNGNGTSNVAPFGTAAGGNSKTRYTEYDGNHSHSLSINSTGVDGTGKNLPPYYALAYIMKL